MNAIELIKKNLNVELILEKYNFEQVTPSGNYYRSACRIHDGSNKSAFVISQETGLWSCHTGNCGSGDIFHLIQKLDECSFPQAVHKLAEILQIDINNLEIVARNQKEQLELKHFLKALESAKHKELVAYEPIGEQKNVKKFKEFDPSTIEYFGLTFFPNFIGASSNGEVRYYHNVLGFPIIKDDILVGYSLRTTEKDATLRWIHQPPHIKTGELLYNFDNVIGSHSVVVVEGITDVWAYHEIGIPAVATYGARITEHQKRLLLQLGCDLVFSFDGDEAGRKAMNKAYELFYKTSNISFVHLPEGKDPENIKREELRDYYERKNNQSI